MKYHREIAFAVLTSPSTLLSSWVWQRRLSLDKDNNLWQASRLVKPTGEKFIYSYRLLLRGVSLEEFTEEIPNVTVRRKVRDVRHT
ncbi:MAG: hypothetical protein L0Y56_20655 [Nitrospira sp.]|nr:hypothetical protein [Nitrospira sp.]